jgi:hypothetical protein
MPFDVMKAKGRRWAEDISCDDEDDNGSDIVVKTTVGGAVTATTDGGAVVCRSRGAVVEQCVALWCAVRQCVADTMPKYWAGVYSIMCSRLGPHARSAS